MKGARRLHTVVFATGQKDTTRKNVFHTSEKRTKGKKGRNLHDRRTTQQGRIESYYPSRERGTEVPVTIFRRTGKGPKERGEGTKSVHVPPVQKKRQKKGLPIQVQGGVRSIDLLTSQKEMGKRKLTATASQKKAGSHCCAGKKKREPRANKTRKKKFKLRGRHKKKGGGIWVAHCSSD